MKAIGLDIGSLTTKIVVMDDGVISYTSLAATGEDPESVPREMLANILKSNPGNNEKSFIITMQSKHNAYATCTQPPRILPGKLSRQELMLLSSTSS